MISPFCVSVVSVAWELGGTVGTATSGGRAVIGAAECERVWVGVSSYYLGSSGGLGLDDGCLASVGRCPVWSCALGPGRGGVLVGVSTGRPPLFIQPTFRVDSKCGVLQSIHGIIIQLCVCSGTASGSQR